MPEADVQHHKINKGENTKPNMPLQVSDLYVLELDKHIDGTEQA